MNIAQRIDALARRHARHDGHRRGRLRRSEQLAELGDHLRLGLRKRTGRVKILLRCNKEQMMLARRPSGSTVISHGGDRIAIGTMTRFLHSMIRVSDPDATIAFFALLGLREVRRQTSDLGGYTLIFLAAPGQEGVAEVELTHNWGEADYVGGRNFGHLAYQVDDIYATCARLMAAGITINRPPRDGHMAFVKTPDGISIELLQKGRLEPREPWMSMANTGSW